MSEASTGRPVAAATAGPFIKVATERTHNKNNNRTRLREMYIDRLIGEMSPANRGTIRAFNLVNEGQGFQTEGRMSKARARSNPDQAGGGPPSGTARPMFV